MIDICDKCQKSKIIFSRRWFLCKPCYEEWMNFKSIKYMNKIRFGGLRYDILKKYNYTCQICGMTNTEHIKQWKRTISVDHKDKNGRYSKTINNSLDNLTVLCLSCHSRKDAILYWHEKVGEIYYG